MSPKISAVIITKNEEDIIEKCLKSITWVDEIIIVDGYSTDTTIEICKNYTNKVFLSKERSFSKNKNLGISKAKNEWILSLDADEIVTNELKKEIIEKIKDDIDGYIFPRKTMYFGKWLKSAYPDYQLRLFKKSKGVFVNIPVHEFVDVRGTVDKMINPLIHYSYRDKERTRKKLERYTTLEVTRIKKAKDFRPNLLNKIKYYIIKPFSVFGYYYILRCGFIDGIAGLSYAYDGFNYNMLVAKKLFSNS